MVLVLPFKEGCTPIKDWNVAREFRELAVHVHKHAVLSIIEPDVELSRRDTDKFLIRYTSSESVLNLYKIWENKLL